MRPFPCCLHSVQDKSWHVSPCPAAWDSSVEACRRGPMLLQIPLVHGRTGCAATAGERGFLEREPQRAAGLQGIDGGALTASGWTCTPWSLRSTRSGVPSPKTSLKGRDWLSCLTAQPRESYRGGRWARVDTLEGQASLQSRLREDLRRSGAWRGCTIRARWSAGDGAICVRAMCPGRDSQPLES